MEIRRQTVQSRDVDRAAAAIGDDVSAWRRLRRLTQAELARRANVSVRTLSRIESGDMSPSIAVLLRIAHVLGQLDALAEAMNPNSSELGMALLRDGLPHRVRAPRPRSDRPQFLHPLYPPG